MAKIDNVKSIISQHNGLAAFNRYRVIMPTFFIGGDAYTMDFLTQSVIFPGIQLDIFDRQTTIKREPIVTGYAVDDVTMTFLLTMDGLATKYFDSWIARIIDKNNRLVGYRSDYARDILIFMQNRDNVPYYTIRLRGAYPYNKNPLTFADSNKDSIVEQVVIFKYEDYEVYDIPTTATNVFDLARIVQNQRIDIPSVSDINSIIGSQINIGGLL